MNQLVTALEKELGFPVFRRNTKGVTLTENGELLLPTVREFLRQEDRIFELSAEMNGLLIGSGTIASYSSISSLWLPAVISAFQRDYPEIHIKLMEGIWQEVSKWLDDRAADIGFFSYQEGMPYEFIPLAEEPMLADDLIELTGIPTRRVLSALTVLEIEHLVTQHSGKRYARAVNLTE